MDQVEPQPLPGQPERPPPGALQPDAHRPTEREQLPAGDRRPASRGAPQDDSGQVTDYDHPVVAGYDGSEPSRNALAYAVGVARRLGRTLLVVYVTSPGVYCEPMSGQIIAPVRDSAATHRWLLAELDEICDRTGIDVRIVTRQGSPAKELAAAADEFSADALVIGAPERLWHQFTGSVPGWLARHAHCPVIVVP
jgi:nucleotide-binding universal stress UspA family protein